MSNKKALASHIDSLMSKIAADKTAEELGSTSFTQPDNGTTKSIPDGGTHSDVEKVTSSTAKSGPAVKNDNPGGETAASVGQLTSDDKSELDVKKGKDQEETGGPKSPDEGAKTAALANELLKAIAELTKSAGAAPAKKADAAAPVASKEAAATKTAEELQKEAAARVKTAAEKFPEAVKSGYEFAQKIAGLILEQQETQAPNEAVKVAAKAEEDAIKVAEFLMGFSKSAMGEVIDPAMLGGAMDPGMGGGAPAGDPMAAAMGGGAPATPGDAAGAADALAGGGMDGGSEAQIIQALADALQAEGITPEQLAQALAAEQGGGAPAPAMGGGDPMAALGGGAPAPEAGGGLPGMGGGAPAAEGESEGGGEEAAEGGESEGAEHEAKESPEKEKSEKKEEPAEEKAEKEASLKKQAALKKMAAQKHAALVSAARSRIGQLKKAGFLKKTPAKK